MKPSFEWRPLKRMGHALACAGLLMACLPSQAAISLVTSRVALGATDSLSWGALGGDSIDALVTPIPAVTSVDGIGATVSNSDPAGDLFRFDQGGANSGFVGSFAAGDKLLSTFGSAGPLVISFSSPVARVGTQIPSIDPGAFTGQVKAFDLGGGLLGTWSVTGTSNSAAIPGSPFLGLVSTEANIKQVSFSVLVPSTDPNPLARDFAINTVSLSVTPVPEPATYLMALAGGAFVLSAVSRRRKAAH